MVSAPKKGQGKRNTHGVKNKQWMIQYASDHPHKEQKVYLQAYQQKFNIKLAKGTLCKWLKNKGHIMSVPLKQAAKTKHIKAPTYVELERLIVAWLSQVDAAGGDVNDDLYLMKAKQAKEMLIDSARESGQQGVVDKYSKWEGPTAGWIQKVKERNNLAM